MVMLFYVYEYFACVCACVCTTYMPGACKGPIQLQIPRTGVTYSCKLPYGCLESNHIHLQEQQVLLTRVKFLDEANYI